MVSKMTQIVVAVTVAIATGLFVLTVAAVNPLNINVPPDVLGLVWA